MEIKNFEEIVIPISCDKTPAQNERETLVVDETGQTKYICEKNGRYYYRHEPKFNGNFIKGKISELITKEISESFEGNVINIKIKTSKKGNMVMPAARVLLKNTREERNIVNILNGAVCKKYGVKSLTISFPALDDARGMRCRIDEYGTRIYEVANGSYDLVLKWLDDEQKECKIRINIRDDGSILLVERNGVTYDQLVANQEVKVGRQYGEKYLKDALSHLF